MNCPHCGEGVPEEAQFCPSCGKATNPAAKLLCDGCMGAFPAGELVRVEGRAVCPLCRAREDRLKSGTPPPGPARMHHTEREFRAAKGMLRPATSVLAVFSLVTVFLCPVGLLSLILGIVALLRIRSRPRELGGAGFAVAGIILGAGALLAMLGVTALAVPFVMTIEKTRDAQRIRVELLRIAAVEEEFMLQFGRHGSWNDLVREGGLDPVSSYVPGYDFEVESTEDGFRVIATPKVGGPSVHYLLDEEKNFRYQDGRPANRFSPVWKSPFPAPPPRRSYRSFSSG